MFQIRHFSIRTFLSVCDCSVVKVMKTRHHHKKNLPIFKEKSGEIKISELQGSRTFFHSITKFPSKTFYDIVIEASIFCIDYKMVWEKKRISVLFKGKYIKERTERCRLRALSEVSPRICVKQQNLGIKLFLICRMNYIVLSNLLNFFT